MPDQTPVTGYRPGTDASGIGGRQREQKIMQAANTAVSGGKPAAPAPNSNRSDLNTAKAHPAASGFAPGPAVSSHVYGAPISEPILSGGKS